ncbi:MAG: beta-galactosidase [Bacteroidales bacterium]|nr:beta-galactosidase [Bacteroidales bacterium]
MKKLSGLLLILLALTACNHQKELYMDLSGKWKVYLDKEDSGFTELSNHAGISETVILPGSLVENGLGDEISVNTRWTSQIVDSSWYRMDRYAPYREEGNIKIPFWLQPELRYVGAAWFQKEVTIPENWSNKHIVLSLERPHWETKLWIDDQEIGMQNSLATPHSYRLTGQLDPGEHIITIRVDNRIKEINPGINSHSLADHTQSNWNGLAGSLSLKALPLVFIEKIRLFPDVERGLLKVAIEVGNLTEGPRSCILKLRASSRESGEKLKPVADEFVVKKSEDGEIFELSYPMGDSPALWDEFDPKLYLLNVELKSGEGVDTRQLSFGMREFEAEGSRFTINGRPLFLRGTLECAIFPKTAYPPTTAGPWIKLLKAARAHGLNHIRFHSWCPPEAAFEAADELGVYLQVECSSWANSGAAVGDGHALDLWLYEEAEQILSSYGNHPSFCMMAYGNEPAGASQVPYLEEFVSYFKKKDPRRIYTGGAGWPYIESAGFFSDPNARIQRWGEGLNSIINGQAPQTAFDYREITGKVPKPYVSHEIGQWCVYPDFKEIGKYDGVLKARNFEIFRETLEASGMAYLADSFLLASGKLQALCYKADIEAALRTPGMAGFQLLDLHDFPGQGTALVGVLDPFWEEKGYITPGEYSRFCNATVPLARMTRRIFTNEETFEATVEVAHFGSEALNNPDIHWKISTRDETILARGRFEKKEIKLDNNLLGCIRFELSQVSGPEKLNLEISVNQYSNDWDFWVYPEHLPVFKENDIYVTGHLDQAALEVLKGGGKVLWTLVPNSLSDSTGGNIALGFSSIFWNTAWTSGQAPHTLGLLCDPAHPALADFPTEFHSNWQWWDAMHHGQAIRLDGIEQRIEPIVRIIDDWFENRPLALVFEARAGEGQILVSGVDLLSDPDKRPEAKQLIYSLKKYMSSSRFQPGPEISMEELQRLTKPDF